MIQRLDRLTLDKGQATATLEVVHGLVQHRLAIMNDADGNESAASISRALATLSLHEFWSVISPGLSISWALAMMECSSPLPVHVDIRISCSSSTNSPSSSFVDGFLPLAASELLFIASRIRTLRLAGLCSNILHVLDRLRSPSSKLESLILSRYDGGGLPVSLPGSLSSGTTKRCLTCVV